LNPGNFLNRKKAHIQSSQIMSIWNWRVLFNMYLLLKTNSTKYKKEKRNPQWNGTPHDFRFVSQYRFNMSLALSRKVINGSSCHSIFHLLCCSTGHQIYCYGM